MERTVVVKGSLTVEGSWIFGISMVIIYLMIAFSFQLYENVNKDIEETEIADIQAVKKFRLLQMGKDILEIDGD